MATPGGLKFLNDINNRNVLQVQHALRKGHAHPNQSYIGVYPLNLAIENVRLGSRVRVRVGRRARGQPNPVAGGTALLEGHAQWWCTV